MDDQNLILTKSSCVFFKGISIYNSIFIIRVAHGIFFFALCDGRPNSLGNLEIVLSRIDEVISFKLMNSFSYPKVPNF